MKRSLFMVCALSLLAAPAALAVVADGGAGQPAAPKNTGGPDSYGYRYVDNDNGDSAAYRWVDTTSGAWTTVTGLGDDNAVGPFNIGFNFPFYWYRVSQFWVHANGGISFSLPARAWTPQVAADAGFPNTNTPNDLVGALGLDLDFTYAGVCKYRVRTTAPESLIISWIGVYRWNTTDPYTFQLILARADSSIRVQIQTVTNIPSRTGSLGIENMAGSVGLGYYDNGSPNRNDPHNTLAIKYVPPATSTYTSTDAGMVWVQNPLSGAVTLHTGDTLRPQARVRNNGTVTLTNLRVVCRIRSGAAVVYADTVTVAALAKAQEQSVSFVRPFTAASAGAYTITARTYAAENPVNAANDSIVVELPVVTYPALVSYDDGARNAWLKWQGTGPANPTGLGNCFELLRAPVSVDSAQAYVNHAAGNHLIVEIYDTTGTGGGPGAVLAADTVAFTTTVAEWVTVGFVAQNVVVGGGRFYVGLKTPDNNLSFGIDRDAPISRRSWEFLTRWSPYRSMESEDLMLRVFVHTPSPPAYFVDASAGNDLNPGTAALPVRTIGRALSMMALAPTTDTCYIRNGTYGEQVNILPAHSGSAAKRTVIAAQAGHAPAIRPAGLAYSLADSAGNYVTISGLTIYPGTQQQAAVIFNGSNVDFSGNTVYTPTMGPALLLVNQANTSIRGNTVLPISDNAYPAEGIWLYGANNTLVDSNKVTAMIDAGILVSNSSGATVRRNVVDQCFFGLSFEGAVNDSAYNNTIDNCSNSGVHVQGQSGELVTRNNNITNSYFGFCKVDTLGSISSDYNDVWNNTWNYKNPKAPGETIVVATGIHDLSANPLYAAGYHLQAGSPCVNMGVVVGLPYLTLPDIGAYEDWAKNEQEADQRASAGPAAFHLGSCCPNPFTTRTTIEYSCPGNGAGDLTTVALRIYNIAGQLVKTLVAQGQRPGTHRITWDGRDDQGRRVSAGIYCCRLQAGGQQQVRSLLFLK